MLNIVFILANVKISEEHWDIFTAKSRLASTGKRNDNNDYCFNVYCFNMFCSRKIQNLKTTCRRRIVENARSRYWLIILFYRFGVQCPNENIESKYYDFYHYQRMSVSLSKTQILFSTCRKRQKCAVGRLFYFLSLCKIVEK